MDTEESEFMEVRAALVSDKGKESQPLKQAAGFPFAAEKRWPAPQRAGHTTQLITTNERERMPAAKKGNAIATKRGTFAPKRAAPAVAGRRGWWTEKTAGTQLQHEPAAKVTANCDERPDVRMSGSQTTKKARPCRRAWVPPPSGEGGDQNFFVIEKCTNRPRRECRVVS